LIDVQQAVILYGRNYNLSPSALVFCFSANNPHKDDGIYIQIEVLSVFVEYHLTQNMETYVIWLTSHRREEGYPLEIIKDLSVNMLILLFPIFIYHLFESRFRNRHRLFIGIASGLAIILCMSFPLDSVKNGHIFDLRQIPLILSGLYGGLYPLISSFLVLIGYRFYLGGEGLLWAFLSILY
jgi:hypothetical protein